MEQRKDKTFGTFRDLFVINEGDLCFVSQEYIERFSVEVADYVRGVYVKKSAPFANCTLIALKVTEDSSFIKVYCQETEEYGEVQRFYLNKLL